MPKPIDEIATPPVSETQDPLDISSETEGTDELTDDLAGDSRGSEVASETPTPVTPAEKDMLDLRRAAAQYGLDMSKYADDDTALKALVEGTRRGQALEQISPYVQDYLQNQAEYRQYLQQKSQPAAPVPPPVQETKYWDSPEWNPQWLTMVKKDETTGQLVPDFASGGTPETVARVQNFINYRQEQQERFWSNPFDYIQGFVDKRAEERARALVQQELGTYTEQQEARQFISANRDWLLAHDQQGQLTLDPGTGAPVLSQEGTSFMRHLQVASEQYGMAPQKAQAYAINMLQADRALRAAGKPADPAVQDAQKKVQFLQKAAGFSPSQAASTNRKSDAQGEPSPQDSTLSLEELMRRNLKAAGVTDDDIAGSH